MTDRTPWNAIVEKARAEPAPPVDVASQVARRIAATTITARQLSNWPGWSAAGLSVAAAVLMMLTATLTGVSWEDPMGDWFSSMFLVMS